MHKSVEMGVAVVVVAAVTVVVWGVVVVLSFIRHSGGLGFQKSF